MGASHCCIPLCIQQYIKDSLRGPWQQGVLTGVVYWCPSQTLVWTLQDGALVSAGAAMPTRAAAGRRRGTHERAQVAPEPAEAVAAIGKSWCRAWHVDATWDVRHTCPGEVTCCCQALASLEGWAHDTWHAHCMCSIAVAAHVQQQQQLALLHCGCGPPLPAVLITAGGQGALFSSECGLVNRAQRCWAQMWLYHAVIPPGMCWCSCLRAFFRNGVALFFL
jgi:hypothetical protein